MDNRATCAVLDYRRNVEDVGGETFFVKCQQHLVQTKHPLPPITLGTVSAFVVLVRRYKRPCYDKNNIVVGEAGFCALLNDP